MTNKRLVTSYQVFIRKTAVRFNKISIIHYSLHNNNTKQYSIHTSYVGSTVYMFVIVEFPHNCNDFINE